MAENLIHRLIPHQGCVITRTEDGIEICGSAMNGVMSAGVVPFTCQQHAVKEEGVISTTDVHEIQWEIRLDRMRVVVDGEVRFEGAGDYSGIESAPSVGPCFGSTVSLRDVSITLG